jgi:uncharacterized protein YoxC
MNLKKTSTEYLTKEIRKKDKEIGNKKKQIKQLLKEIKFLQDSIENLTGKRFESKSITERIEKEKKQEINFLKRTILFLLQYINTSENQEDKILMN